MSENIASPVERSQETARPLSSDQKRELVKRVMASQAFSRTPAMRAFLQFITENAILGRTDKLKEQTIGTEVLGRPADYNPTDDNIVRVRAHELRGRLERYFSTEGATEPVVITIPRGGYAPEFVPRPIPVPVPAEPAIAKPSAIEETGALPGPVPADLPERSGQLPSKQSWALLAAVIVAAVVLSSGITQYLMRSQGSSGFPRPATSMRDFWGQFFDRPGVDLKVVYADTSFALWQDLNGTTLDLGDYLNRQYFRARGNQVFNVVMRRVTTPADMALSVHLATLAGEFGGQEFPQFARDADSQFFHQGNIVLIGSHRSNPWVWIYEPSLNFTLDQDPKSGAPMYRNRAPRAGEPSTFGIPDMYDTQKTEEKTYPSYGVVALLKGCGDHGFTVLVEGLNTQATQAAGDFITDPQRMDALLSAVGHQPGTRVGPFEALFQVTSLPGGYDDPKVIAYRLRAPGACVGG